VAVLEPGPQPRVVQDQVFDDFDDDTLDNPWPALGRIVFSAIVTVTAFLLAPF
jgi:hypothetical protein